MDRALAIVLVVFAISIVALFAILAYRAVYLLKKHAYLTTPGAIIHSDGVEINGDGGPRNYPWAEFGEAFISTLNGRPIIQHLAIRDLGLDGYQRYSSYMLTPIDHIAMPADAFLDLLKKQPGFPHYSGQEGPDIA